MSNKNIQSILDEALEQELPSSQIRLWPSIQAQLAAGKHVLLREGEKMNSPKLRLKNTAFVTVMVVLLLALASNAPQGRALAQAVLQFFTRLEVDNYYEEPSDLTFEDTTPFHEECGIWIAPKCSVEQIRSKVDFEVKELAILPEGMFYSGATGGPDLVGLAYLYGDRDRLGGLLSVVVEPAGKRPPIVAKSANVEEVQIGDLPGEFYTGILFQDEQGNVTWQPNDPTMTVRWQDGGSTYSLTYYSTRHPLSKEDLVRLAGSMTLEPVVKDPAPR
ncbi:MAG TPA: hypothetical protein VFR47_25775 [Anaerolineales bacterium]|nr:hypothetical protein [Anaerolineales bacterium]